MADTCRHEWALGDDGCVNCGESWAALHPEDEGAPAERRGLNRLLASFPAAEVTYVGGLQYRIDQLVSGPRADTPWLSCDLKLPLSGWSRRFAIWKVTGNVYLLDDDGAVEDDPIIKVAPP